ncbi:MAG: efflux RND transporter periplasmic adaptor subunit, partial [Alistipes sp.]|nr:efflux RND transporter periplasmic adaptor subunit [Alistipes sp.]
MERLLAHEAVSRQEAEAARTRFAQARSVYENALDLLQETRLRAPFPGVIEATYVDSYQQVQAGQAILRLVAPRTTTVKFTMPERGLSSLADSSARFEVEFDNFRGVRFAARLKEYARTSSDASGFPVSLRLAAVDTLRYDISPGMSCTVTMFSADPVPDAVSLPLSAIYAPAGGGTFVWVVGDDDRVSLREVALGELFGSDRVVIDRGLSPGERVVSAGVYRLQPDEEVRILPTAP